MMRWSYRERPNFLMKALTFFVVGEVSAIFSERSAGRGHRDRLG